MSVKLKSYKSAIYGLGAVAAFGFMGTAAIAQAKGAAKSAAPAPCVDYSNDPAGCQPAPFPTPTGQIPSRRMGKDGKIDPKSTEADDRAGAKLVEKSQHLYRNLEELQWIVTVPSEKEPGTGNWKGGDLDAEGDGRGLGVAGNCVYTGHANGPGKKHDINIFKLPADPATQPVLQVGAIPAMAEGNRGFDDRELRSIVYKTSGGQSRQILVRNGGTASVGRQMTYTIDQNTCLVTATSEITEFGGQSHEFFLWHDPANTNRILVYITIWTANIPDPNFAGLHLPDLYVLAITDENTGEPLKKAQVLAAFDLEDVGGPIYNEKPDATGLFSDGRFIDYTVNKDLNGRPGNLNKTEQNRFHSLSILDSGDRAYVAGTTAGFYVLNTEAIAHHKNSELAAGQAGCNLRSTIAAVDGVVDAAKLPDIANDCVHMVVDDDPGLKMFLASGASPAAKIERYHALEDRSRFDTYPPFDAVPTGSHSAVFVPNRPAEVAGNTKNLPAYVWVTDENGGCPLNFARMISIEQEATPAMVGAFAIPDNVLDNCLNQAITEPDGVTKRRPIAQQNHNPTVFKNLVFNTWYGHGLRVIDISNPMTPREVGYGMPAPQGIARTYPVFRDGLIYINDNRSGLHILRYFGPRANEVPTKGVYEGNASSPHD